MQHRHEQVVVETQRHRISGTITLARDGYRSRVSDLLNATEREFLSMTDVTIERLDGSGATTQHAFISVNSQQIVFALLSEGDRPSHPPPA
jgi:hypothetical protein